MHNPQKAQHHHTRGQSPAAQAIRLDRGDCPVHGIGLNQISRWLRDDSGKMVTIVACPRKDCDETWIATSDKNDPRIIPIQPYSPDIRLYDDFDWIYKLESQIKELEARLAQYEGGAS